MKSLREMTAEELIEFIFRSKNLSGEEIRKLCNEWLYINKEDNWFW